MTLNLLTKRMGGAILGLCLLVGIGIASSVPAQAQWQNDRAWQREQLRRQRELQREQIRRQREAQRNNGYYQNEDWRYGASNQLRQTALNAGYNEGIKEGRNDRQHGDRFDYRDEGDYQNATVDYSSRLGNREMYRQYFRQGFANGYNDGFRGY